jgi:hypothetical protein
MQTKATIKEWKEKLEQFKEKVIELIRNVSYKALRGKIMMKLEEISNICYKNRDNNQAIIEAEKPKADNSITNQ